MAPVALEMTPLSVSVLALTVMVRAVSAAVPSEIGPVVAAHRQVVRSGEHEIALQRDRDRSTSPRRRRGRVVDRPALDDERVVGVADGAGAVDVERAGGHRERSHRCPYRWPHRTCLCAERQRAGARLAEAMTAPEMTGVAIVSEAPEPMSKSPLAVSTTPSVPCCLPWCCSAASWRCRWPCTAGRCSRIPRWCRRRR